MRNLIFAAILLGIAAPGFAETKTFTTFGHPIPIQSAYPQAYQTPQYAPTYTPQYNQYPRYNRAMQPNSATLNSNAVLAPNAISALERSMFNRVWKQDDNLTRIQRLEQQVFGSVQHGDLNSRYQRLQNTINNQYYYPNNYSGYNTTPQKGFWGNLVNSFAGGALTGITPGISGVNMIDPFYTGGNGYYNGIQSQNGGGNYFYDTGSSSGVRILD